ncbi:MAG: DUF3846 domain-containing protein [Clostridia bacterium]|nr:DUF3846 domain-containing protein [Clostridia bacterium]
MKVLVVKPMDVPFVKHISGSLNSMQKIVGGTIQAIYPFENPEIALICNDDGKLIKLPLNRALYDKGGKLFDIVAGTFFLCRAPADSENFESLTDEQIKIYWEQFKDIEIYIRR